MQKFHILETFIINVFLMRRLIVFLNTGRVWKCSCRLIVRWLRLLSVFMFSFGCSISSIADLEVICRAPSGIFIYLHEELVLVGSA